MIPSGSNGRRTAWDLEFDERGVKRTQEDQAMNPIVGTHTKENMSAAKEEKQEDTMCKETNCNNYHQLIRLFGAPNGLCSSITENKHITVVKKPYCRSNKYKALSQILVTNQ